MSVALNKMGSAGKAGVLTRVNVTAVAKDRKLSFVMKLMSSA